ncbi:MAG TPA: 50S ribosomal protein L28 [Limnochordia bacterium]|nr:50S ribosomal protein L28 [Limnochordia bacterium]
MARRCSVCAKETSSGNNVSHSVRKTRRVWLANVQRVRINDGGTHRRAYVCTKCLKAGKVAKAI